MNNLITIISFFILIGSKNLIAQNRYENYRAVEGGGVKVNIDNKTDLKTLILNLEKDWELEMTGKGYWIGYTDLMYSIASRKEKAIKPLINFYNSTNTENGKSGVLLTLHLIGIESTITGRITEKFVNQKARNSLLNYIYSKNEKIRDLAMELLMRDPWLSDVPVLMDAMEKSDNVSWSIVNGLMRYEIPNKPFQEKIPRDIAFDTLQYNVPRSFKMYDDPFLSSFYHKILKKAKNKFKESISVEESLFEENLYGYSGKSNSGLHLQFENILNSLVNNYVGNYCNLGQKVQYYVENDIVFICSSQTAKNRWLKWWEKNKSNWIKK